MRPCPPLSISVSTIGILFLSWTTAWTQDAEDEFHLFTPKQGNSIEAKLLNVSADWTMMQIQNREGRTFEVGTNLVSLDDQQYIKDWIKNKPTKSDFELDVKITKKVGSVDRKKYSGSYDLEKRDVTYTIEVLNKSIETLPTPKIEYITLTADGAQIFEAGLGSGSWTYSTSPDPDVVGKYGTVDFDDLVFNREQSLVTAAIPMDKVVGDGNFVLGEDEILGVLVKVSTADGKEVGLYRSNESGASRYTWEAALEEVKGGDRMGRRRRMLMDDIDTNREPVKYSLVKSVKVDGPIDVENRTLSFDATVSPSGKSDGVIVALGGKARGFAVYLEDRKINVIQQNNGESKIISAATPLGEFDLSVQLNADMLTLLVDGRNVAEEASLGFYEGPTNEGIDVGLDSGLPPLKVGDYDDDFPFAGTIRNAVLVLGGDQ